MKPILFIGPVPPPVTGRTAVTDCIYKKLRAEGVPLVFANTAPKRRWPRRIGRFATAFLRLWVARTHKVSLAYIVVDAGWGMYHTILIVSLARLLGLEVLLHHHVYSYVRAFRARMALLARVAGPASSHVVLSRRMAQDLKRQYPKAGRSLVVGNFCFAKDVNRQGHRNKRGALQIGHLSNLTIEKGLGRVRETAEALSAKGVFHEILLAGPASTPAAQCALEAWPRSAASRLRYLGPVYGAQKIAFFKAIDVFLFPSLYDHEAAPLVCIEAMAAGVPVIAFDVGCIRELLGQGGRLVAPDEDFAAAAAAILADWAKGDQLLQSYRIRAREAYLDGLKKSERELDHLIHRLRSSGTSPRQREAGANSTPGWCCAAEIRLSGQRRACMGNASGFDGIASEMCQRVKHRQGS